MMNDIFKNSLNEQLDAAIKDFAGRLHVDFHVFERALKAAGLRTAVDEDYKKLQEIYTNELVKVLFNMKDHLAAKLDKGNDEE